MIGSPSGPTARQREQQLKYLERDHRECEREIEASRARSELFERARWDYILRRRGRDESMAGHAAKTLAVSAIIRKVQQREEKQRLDLLKERDELEVTMEREREEIERQREEEERERRQQEERGREAQREQEPRGGRRGRDRDDDRDHDIHRDRF